MDLPAYRRPVYRYGHLLADRSRADVLVVGLNALDLAHIGTILPHEVDLGANHAADDLHTHYGRLGLAEYTVGQQAYSSRADDRLQSLLLDSRLLLLHPLLVAL